MNKNLDIRDLSIVLAVRDHNPAMLTPEFLKGSGIVPADWELAQPPVLTKGSAQVSFRNGINIAAQPGTVTFSQSMGTAEALEQTAVVAVVQQYVRALPHLDYRAVGINPRRFVTFGERSDGAHKYITENILCHDGGWQEVGDAPLQASVNLVYSLQGVPLRLSINEVRLQLPEGEAMPAVLFAGNFHHELAVENGADRLAALLHQLEGWRGDWDAFQDILAHKFLSQAQMDWVLSIEDAAGVGLLR